MIKLDDNFTIEKDNYNFMLRYESDVREVYSPHHKKIVEASTKETTYHGTLKQALKSYVNKTLMVKEHTTLEGVLEEIKKLEYKIDNLKLTL